MNTNRIALVTVVWTATLTWQDAHAYVDPGTGTILIQWLFGAVMAGLAVLSVYWQRAKGFLARKFGGHPSGEDSDREPKEAGSD